MAKEGVAMTPWTMQLPADATAPAVARHAVEEQLGDVSTEVRRDAQIVVSELVADAVRQGRPPIELSLTASGDRARIEISHAGVAHGRRPPEDWSRRIVTGLSSWGVSGDEAHVWFEVPVDRPPRR
jgi:anti-sigma regulatory factor (Ser/Thr protein kinase)